MTSPHPAIPPVSTLFGLTYAALAIGRVPGLRIDRAGIALVGAVAMLGFGVMGLDDAARAVDFETIVLLFGMMVVVAYLRFAGFFTMATDWVAVHAAGIADGERGILLVGGGKAGKTSLALAALEAGWRFADEAHLRAFLVKLTRHRFIDHLRRHRTAAARERSLGELVPENEPQSRLPSASEVVQANELLEQMLELCPPAHRDIVQLRMRGMAVAEIATRTGLHVGSVHRIFHDLACRVAVGRRSAARAGAAEAT